MEHFMMVTDFYRLIFHTKTYKLSLNGGCTCPTRDGSLGRGGCIFCSQAGSGDFVPAAGLDIPGQIAEAKSLLAPKLKNSTSVKYIAYFQNFTNTYGNQDRLRANWEAAISCPDVVGLALGTRPDCLSEECLKLLGQLADRTFLQVELGLQTSSNVTADYIRRGFETQVYNQSVEKLHKANPKIHVVTHIIFGLPGENRAQMMDSVQTAVAAGSDGIKITCLYVLKYTDLESDFAAGKFSCLTMGQYFDLVRDALKLLPPNMVVHRLTGDPPKSLIIEPKWTMNKKVVLNEMNKIISSC